MARKKRTRDARHAAEYRQHLRETLPPAVTLDDMGELCRVVHPDQAGFGCSGDSHSRDFTTEKIVNSEFCYRRDEILSWLADLGGVCDCTIHEKALLRVIRLSQDLWD